MINIARLKVEAKRYSDVKAEHTLVKERLKQFEKDNKDLNYLLRVYEALKFAGSNSKYKSLSGEFLEKNSSIVEYRVISKMVMEKRYKLTEFVDNSGVINSKDLYILLDRYDNKKVFVSLLGNEVLEFGEDELYITNYLTEVLTNKNLFLGEYSEKELPLLMNILNDVYYSKKKKNIDDLLVRINEEMDIAGKFDNGKYSVYVSDSDYTKENQNLYFSFEDGRISDEEYYSNYYYNYILKYGNVEELYEKTSDDKKKYVIDAYMDLVKTKGKNHVRTSSSLVNQEVLKRGLSK